MMGFASEGEENIGGRGENAKYYYFLLFLRVVKVWDCVLTCSQTSPGFYVSTVKVF